MGVFTSRRERRLWLWAALVLVAIYSTLGLANSLAGKLRDRDLLGTTLVLGFGLLLVAVLLLALRLRPNVAEIVVSIGVVAVYVMAFTRMGIPEEERTHLVEYGLLAALIYQALIERSSNGQPIKAPATIAVSAVALVGWVDEGIQAMLPERVYDLRDVGFNAAAALMAVLASVALAWARRYAPTRIK